MNIVNDVVINERLAQILSLDADRRRQVIKILLQHGKEQGMPENMQDLLKLCFIDEYAKKVCKELI